MRYATSRVTCARFRRMPHHGGPLGQGVLEGSIVTCPWHAWEFDTGNGACTFNDKLRVPTYAVRIEGGEILVDLPEHA